MGINSGDVVAGVIGAHKFIYDIGVAANVASRLELNSLPGRIQVSASTYEHLCRDLVLAPRDGLEIKEQGRHGSVLSDREKVGRSLPVALKVCGAGASLFSIEQKQEAR